jgi:hypothetical protein
MDAAKQALVQATELCAETLVWLTMVEDPDSKRQLETKWRWTRRGIDRLARARPRRFMLACC